MVRQSDHMEKISQNCGHMHDNWYDNIRYRRMLDILGRYHMEDRRDQSQHRKKVRQKLRFITGGELKETWALLFLREICKVYYEK